MYVVQPDKNTSFNFEIDGQEYSVPFVKHLPLNKMRDHDKTARKLKGNDRANFEVEFLARVFDDYAPGVTDALTLDQFKDLVDAYVTESNVSPGE